eukprot:1214651-Pyramimonas_sp.AAC.1
MGPEDRTASSMHRRRRRCSGENPRPSPVRCSAAQPSSLSQPQQGESLAAVLEDPGTAAEKIQRSNVLTKIRTD